MPEGYSNEDVSSEKPIKVPDKPAVAVQKDTQNKILANKDNLNASAVKFCISFLQARRDELEEKEIPDNEELTVIAYQDYLDKLISMLKKALKDMK